MAFMSKPESRMDWRNMTPAQRREEGAPSSDKYLKPGTKTYPYMVWDRKKKKWRISLLLLNSAISLGNLHGETAVVAKAQRIKRREFGD